MLPQRHVYSLASIYAQSSQVASWIHIIMLHAGCHVMMPKLTRDCVSQIPTCNMQYNAGTGRCCNINNKREKEKENERNPTTYLASYFCQEYVCASSQTQWIYTNFIYSAHHSGLLICMHLYVSGQVWTCSNVYFPHSYIQWPTYTFIATK